MFATKSLVASLIVLGTSTVALAKPSCETPAPAQPVQTWKQPAYAPPVQVRPAQEIDRDHDRDRDDRPTVTVTPVRAPKYTPPAWERSQPSGHGPVVVTQPAWPKTLFNGAHIGAKGYAVINLDGAHAYRTLTVEGEVGLTKVKQVQIIFADNDSMVVREGKTLGDDQALTIDLGAYKDHAIAAVRVYGSEVTGRGSFKLKAV